MTTLFVPDDFIVPDGLIHDHFILQMLEPSINELDYQTVMSSRENLRSIFAEHDEWPTDDMTLADNLNDLIAHEKEFIDRIAFAYTVLTPDKSKCIGCIYIEPSNRDGVDCETFYWLSDDNQHLFNEFEEILKSWLKGKWPFNNIAYPGRSISWQQWGSRSHSHI
jgi:hypothetical protein